MREGALGRKLGLRENNTREGCFTVPRPYLSSSWKEFFFFSLSISNYVDFSADKEIINIM